MFGSISLNTIFIIFISQILFLLLFQNVNFSKFIKKYESIQKIHDGEVYRIGGLFYFIPLTVIFFLPNEDLLKSFNLIYFCSGIIFLFILYEDLRQSLSIKFRIIILFITTLFFVIIADLPEIKISFINLSQENFIIFHSLFILSLIMVINGFNFIDGLNGLSSFNYINILMSIYYIAYFQQDEKILHLASLLIFLSIFFLIINFPFGLFFLGDSGAYLYGFLSGTVTIVLFQRNPELPTLLAMVILAYPITETVFSIYRKLIKKFSPLNPDNLHLHHLIFDRLKGNSIKRNNLAALLMAPFWLSPFIMVIFSYSFSLNNFLISIIYFSFYCISYYFLKNK